MECTVKNRYKYSNRKTVKIENVIPERKVGKKNNKSLVIEDGLKVQPREEGKYFPWKRAARDKTINQMRSNWKQLY